MQLIVASLLSLSCLPACADEILPGPIPARIERVIDGDTIDVTATIWPGLTTHARVRFASIDAPELNSPCAAAREKAIEARSVVENALASGSLVLVNIRPEHAYGRILADVRLADGSDLGELLLSIGLAKPYRKKVRCDWCAAAPRCTLAAK